MKSGRCSRLVPKLLVLQALIACQTVQTPDEGTWGTDGSIDDSVFTGSSPRVAMGATGGAVAVWPQASDINGTGDNIWSNRCSPEGEWGTAELIENNDAGNAIRPQVAVDPGGNAIAVWQQSDGTRVNIWWNRSSPDGEWDAAKLLETDDDGDAVRPQVAVDSEGNAVAVWQQNDGAQESIWSSFYTAGVDWEPPVPVAPGVAGDAMVPEVAVSPSGHAVAVWQQASGRRSIIFANRATLGGSWETPRPIDDDNSGDAVGPRVAIDANGRAAAVWVVRSEGARKSVWANRSGSDGVWGTPRTIDEDSGDAAGPKVAMDSDGNAIAVWRQDDGTHFNIWASRSAVNGDWGGAERLEGDAGNARSPQLAMDPTGNALAVWAQFDGTQRIWSNRFTPSTGWGRRQPVQTGNVSDLNFSNSPQIAMDPNGNATAVWRQDDGDPRISIWANRYE